MEQANLPPQKPYLPNIMKIITQQQSKQNEDRIERYMVFLPHDVSRRMNEQLKKENSDIHRFVHQACVAHLNKVDNEKQLLDTYLAYSDLQLSENPTPAKWAYNEEDEDIFAQPRTNNNEKEGE